MYCRGGIHSGEGRAKASLDVLPEEKKRYSKHEIGETKKWGICRWKLLCGLNPVGSVKLCC